MGFKDVCMKFKIFICSDCKSAHQAFSHRCKVCSLANPCATPSVSTFQTHLDCIQYSLGICCCHPVCQSITMSNWNRAEVMELDGSTGGGNAAHNATFLARLPEGTRRPQKGCHPNDLKEFVKDVYIDLRYCAPCPFALKYLLHRGSFDVRPCFVADDASGKVQPSPAPSPAPAAPAPPRVTSARSAPVPSTCSTDLLGMGTGPAASTSDWTSFDSAPTLAAASAGWTSFESSSAPAAPPTAQAFGSFETRALLEHAQRASPANALTHRANMRQPCRPALCAQLSRKAAVALPTSPLPQLRHRRCH